jgi:RNA polymerase-binding transcription factor DksA
MTIAQTRPARPTRRRSGARTAERPTALTAAELGEIREQLNLEIRRLQLEAFLATQQAIDFGRDRDRPEGADEMDQCLSHTIQDEQTMLAERSAARLASCRRALERLDDGTHGTCEQCQQQIHPQRLLAIPRATTCLDCASRLTR